MNQPRRRDEAILERQVLINHGQTRDLALYRNEVGVSYRAAIKKQIEDCELLAPQHVRAVLTILARNRIAHGLGKGSPDLIGCARGRFIGLELKSPEGRLEEDQRVWHLAAARAGADIAVIRSLAEADSFIELALQDDPAARRLARERWQS